MAVPKKFSRPNKLVDIEAMTNHLEQVSVSLDLPMLGSNSTLNDVEGDCASKFARTSLLLCECCCGAG